MTKSLREEASNFVIDIEGKIYSQKILSIIARDTKESRSLADVLIKHNDIFKHHNQKQFICYHFSWIHTATLDAVSPLNRRRLHIYFFSVSKFFFRWLRFFLLLLLFFRVIMSAIKNSCLMHFFAMTFYSNVFTL